MVEYSENSPAHLFADTVPALARMRGTAEASSCRILSAILIGPETDPADVAVPGASVLIELERDAADEAVIALLDWSQREAARGARRSVVSAPHGLIDLIAARVPHPDVEHLCEASEAERLAAVVRAGRPIPARLHDPARENGALILQQLSEDAGRIAAILATLSNEEPPAARPAQDRDEPGFDAATIRTMIRARRLRDQYFRGDLFADPAWDMLLDLMAARLEKTKVAVSSLCIAASVPATTALRWIKALTDRGLFVRVADPEDGRRIYIELSDETARALGAYLRQVRRFPVLAV